MRLRKKPGTLEKLKELNDLVYLNPGEDIKDKWSLIFVNKNPLHVEIGTGKGAFLSAMSQMYREVNFVGLEKTPEVLCQAACKLKEAAAGAQNTRLLYADAGNLADFFQAQSVERIYLNYSDPWPKKRHAPRRLTSPVFLEIYKLVLKKGGEIHFKTDNRDFFEYSLLRLINAGFSLKRITYDLQAVLGGQLLEALPINVRTEYEERFISNGQPICRCEAVSPL